MPFKYRDNVTGKVYEFDHQPTEAELHQRAQEDNSQSTTEAAVTSVGLPMAGALIGGKTPLGPIGSGIGAATGQAYGDLYNMIQSARGKQGYGEIPTPGEEAARLATTAGLTAAGEKILPPIMKGLGKILPAGPVGRTAASTGLGWMFGHPGIGAGLGIAGEVIPKIGQAIEYIGTPAKSGPLAGGLSAGSAGALSDLGERLGLNRLKNIQPSGIMPKQSAAGVLPTTLSEAEKASIVKRYGAANANAIIQKLESQMAGDAAAAAAPKPAGPRARLSKEVPGSSMPSGLSDEVKAAVQAAKAPKAPVSEAPVKPRMTAEQVKQAGISAEGASRPEVTPQSQSNIIGPYRPGAGPQAAGDVTPESVQAAKDAAAAELAKHEAALQAADVEQQAQQARSGFHVVQPEPVSSPAETPQESPEAQLLRFFKTPQGATGFNYRLAQQAEQAGEIPTAQYAREARLRTTQPQPEQVPQPAEPTTPDWVKEQLDLIEKSKLSNLSDLLKPKNPLDPNQ